LKQTTYHIEQEAIIEFKPPEVKESEDEEKAYTSKTKALSKNIYEIRSEYVFKSEYKQESEYR